MKRQLTLAINALVEAPEHPDNHALRVVQPSPRKNPNPCHIQLHVYRVVTPENVAKKSLQLRNKETNASEKCRQSPANPELKVPIEQTSSCAVCNLAYNDICGIDFH